MRLIALEIPDDALDLAGWIEGHLVGQDLSALVAELEAVHSQGHERAEPPHPLETILGSQRDAVLAGGLTALPSDRLRDLLRHPRLLIDLQDLIFESGRPYWHQRAESTLELATSLVHKAAVDRDWDWLTANVIEAPAAGVPIGSGTARATAPVIRPRSRSRWRVLSVLSLAAAAAVVLVVFAVSRRPDGDRPGNEPSDPRVATAPGWGWGWNRPGALPQDLARNDYFNHLADGAQSWFNQRPDDAVALAKRLTEFRQGCTVLIQSPHKPLPDEDRLWLVGKCRDWAAKLDAHLAALESGQGPLQVRREADETINKLIGVLRQRARGTA
jgi:hypothetical protein